MTKLLLQECVVRGKQIQVPIMGKAYMNIYGQERHGGGGMIPINICTPGDAKLGHALAEEIVKVLRAHGYEFDAPSRWDKKKKVAKR